MATKTASFIKSKQTYKMRKERRHCDRVDGIQQVSKQVTNLLSKHQNAQKQQRTNKNKYWLYAIAATKCPY